MITAVFSKRNSIPYGLHVSGHSGFAPVGADIVCSAVSSAVILTANLLKQQDDQLLGMSDDGLFVLFSEHASAAPLLSGLQDHLIQLQKQYPQYIRVYNLNLNGGNTNV